MVQETTSYINQGKEFLSQAYEELSDGDLRQASEKGWGAASQIVKALAAARGWEHGRHSSLYQAVGQLVAETGDQEFRLLFAVAGELHSNFYEGFLAFPDVEAHLGHVKLFVEKVERRI
jgi:uncharacterized protein (UPF0332 family)